MSDLASPLLAVMRDEAEAFWCFAALMERLQANFHTDCTGMHAQLAGLKVRTLSSINRRSENSCFCQQCWSMLPKVKVRTLSAMLKYVCKGQAIWVI